MFAIKTAVVLFLALAGCSSAAPMTTERIMELVDFINTVPLAKPKASNHYYNTSYVTDRSTTDNQKQGFVDSGSLVSFTNRVKGQQKDDVLNAALFGQLAAEYQYNRETQTVQWYNYYSDVMEKIGWVMQDFEFQHYQVSGGKFSMDKVVIDILSAIATGDEIVVATEVLSALKNLADDDGRIVLFEHHSYNNQAGNFQIIPCNQDDSGQVVMALAGFHFQAKQDTTKFLFFEWDSDSVDIYKSVQVVTLNQDVYSAVRSSIVSRLGDQAKTLVDNIPLA